MNKLALLDIDGVIYDGHVIFDVIQDEEKRGFIGAGTWGKIEALLKQYKAGLKQYKQTAEEMLAVYAMALKGKKYRQVFEDNLRFIENNEQKVLLFWQGLRETHDVYLVTTNFYFTAGAAVKHFALSGFISSKVEVRDGIITGKVDLSLAGNKGIVGDLINKYGRKGSVAIGDSENDVDMLEMVERPLVMEPNERLAAVAKERGWRVIDRKTAVEGLGELRAT